MKKKNIFIQEYQNSYTFFKKIKPFLFFAILIFASTIFIGYFFPHISEEQIKRIIQGMLLELEGKNTIELIIHIFLNNLNASFIGMILGIFFGIFPLITGLFNGYLIGYVSNIAIQTHGIFVLFKLLPHGIFELPAILISLGIGLYLGNRFLEKYFKVKERTKRIAIMCFSTLTLVPLASFYYIWSLKLLEIQKAGFSSLSNSYLPLAIAIAIIDIAIIGGFFFVVYQFLKEKELRKDIIDSIIFFILIIFPLLLVAAIIEGLLIQMIG